METFYEPIWLRMVGDGSDSFSNNEVSEGLEELILKLWSVRSVVVTDPVVKKSFDYFFCCHIFYRHGEGPSRDSVDDGQAILILIHLWQIDYV